MVPSSRGLNHLKSCIQNVVNGWDRCATSCSFLQAQVHLHPTTVSQVHAAMCEVLTAFSGLSSEPLERFSSLFDQSKKTIFRNFCPRRISEKTSFKADIHICSSFPVAPRGRRIGDNTVSSETRVPSSVEYKAMLGLIQVCGMSQAMPTQPLPQCSSTAAAVCHSRTGGSH